MCTSHIFHGHFGFFNPFPLNLILEFTKNRILLFWHILYVWIRYMVYNWSQAVMSVRQSLRPSIRHEQQMEFIYTTIKYKISHLNVKIQFNDQDAGERTTDTGTDLTQLTYHLESNVIFDTFCLLLRRWIHFFPSSLQTFLYYLYLNLNRFR